TTLAANTPEQGTGLWTVENGVGGSFNYDTLPDAIFTGQQCSGYTLAWSISNICNTTTDLVDITFHATPTPAYAGNDIVALGGATRVWLNANTPDMGNGLWTIVSGEGGILDDATNPASLFTGEPYIEYILQWGIYTACDTTFANVKVTLHWNCGYSFTDARDGTSYKSVQIGSQCWMAENLRYSDSGSGEFWCYDNVQYNCDTYGVLYGWTTAVWVCPGGWHLPTDDEWKVLEGTVDSKYPVGDPEWQPLDWRGFDAGKNLKSALYGFRAWPGGFRNDDGWFNEIGYNGFWWSSTLYEYWWWLGIDDDAWMRKLAYGLHKDESQRLHRTKSMGYSVRCVKDENRLPTPPSTPQPEGILINTSQETTLSWTCSDPDDDPLIYDVYFGTEATPSLVAAGISDNFYNVGTLEKPTKYFWKVVARDGHGDSMTVGDVWFFTIWPCGEPIIDERDGQEYATVLIGNQCWMAENLRYSDAGTGYFHCYEDDYTNCVIYGVLYGWTTALWVCPSGWHLPSDHEWKILEGTVDSQYPVGDHEWD
ncbi:MAG: hypothetical protein GY746_05970, partial [Gammaproteobacteria bacterium]|nr:hypothetical protein [Gammaproteobacteria bacterium]